MHYLIRLFPILAFLLGNSFSSAQSFDTRLFTTYDDYKEQTITDRRFKHEDLEALLQKLQSPFEVNEIGKSLEGRPIYMVKIGTGYYEDGGPLQSSGTGECDYNLTSDIGLLEARLIMRPLIIIFL